jgi:outer membrane protein assembly factor BamE (lipoprotein component of BamABCDE complex)
LLPQAAIRLFTGKKTIYASGYSQAQFDKIRAGMSESEVNLLLGQPFLSSTQHWSEVWMYSPVQTNKPARNSFDLFGSFSRLKFDESGRVLSMSGNYLSGNFVGKTKMEVTNLIGAPSEQEVKSFQVLLFYSKPDHRGSGTYKQRVVALDATGKVSSTRKETFYD